MPNPKRKCREYERLWHERCVDANLQDPWLERLNALTVLDLINICEGHPQRSKRAATRYAHIYFKLKEGYLQDLIYSWQDLRPRFLQEVQHRFQDGDTYLNFEVNIKLRSGPGRLVYQEELLLKLRAYQLGGTPGLDPATQAWFLRNVERIEGFDRAIHQWLAYPTPDPSLD